MTTCQLVLWILRIKLTPLVSRARRQSVSCLQHRKVHPNNHFSRAKLVIAVGCAARRSTNVQVSLTDYEAAFYTWPARAGRRWQRPAASKIKAPLLGRSYGRHQDEDVTLWVAWRPRRAVSKTIAGMLAGRGPQAREMAVKPRRRRHPCRFIALHSKIRPRLTHHF